MDAEAGLYAGPLVDTDKEGVGPGCRGRGSTRRRLHIQGITAVRARADLSEVLAQWTQRYTAARDRVTGSGPQQSYAGGDVIPPPDADQLERLTCRLLATDSALLL